MKVPAKKEPMVALYTARLSEARAKKEATIDQQLREGHDIEIAYCERMLEWLSRFPDGSDLPESVVFRPKP